MPSPRTSRLRYRSATRLDCVGSDATGFDSDMGQVSDFFFSLLDLAADEEEIRSRDLPADGSSDKP